MASKTTEVNDRIGVQAIKFGNRDLIRALKGGTKEMRKQGRTFLPQEENEEDEAYAKRLERSFLFNAFNRTVQFLNGKPFAKPISIDYANTEVEAWAEDIDRQGRNLTEFAIDALEALVEDGMVHILVDMQTMNPEATQQEEADTGLRPYGLLIKDDDLLGFRRNGEMLSQIRISEVVTEDDGDFGEELLEQVRVYEPGKFQVWRQKKGSGIKTDQSGLDNAADTLNRVDHTGDGSLAGREGHSFELVDEGIMTAAGGQPLSMIPLITIYTNRRQFMFSDPPLRDLAETNIAHWRSDSDQRNILHVARVPILAVYGITEDEKEEFTVGPNSVQMFDSHESKMEYVKAEVAPIEAGRQDLIDLEDRMEAQGLELLAKTSGTATATEKIIDSAANTSQLAQIVSSLEKGLEKMFELFGEWTGQDEVLEGGISIHKEFGINLSLQELDTLLKSRLAGEITRETYLQELQRRNVLSQSFDADEEIKSLTQSGDTDDGGDDDLGDGDE